MAYEIKQDAPNVQGRTAVTAIVRLIIIMITCGAASGEAHSPWIHDPRSHIAICLQHTKTSTPRGASQHLHGSVWAGTPQIQCSLQASQLA